LSLLSSEVLSIWNHVSQRLTQHENNVEHTINMNTWNEFKTRRSKKSI